MELAKAGRYLYAHEISCSQVPQLGDRLYQPKYFRNNFQDLSSINDPDSYQLMQESHFPSFFFGPRGSTSPLHSDGTPPRQSIGVCKQILCAKPRAPWGIVWDTYICSSLVPILHSPTEYSYRIFPILVGHLVREVLLQLWAGGSILFLPWRTLFHGHALTLEVAAVQRA